MLHNLFLNMGFAFLGIGLVMQGLKKKLGD
jgi:hypothetical protein